MFCWFLALVDRIHHRRMRFLERWHYNCGFTGKPSKTNGRELASRARSGKKIRQNVIGSFWPIKQIWVNLIFNKPNDFVFEKYLHRSVQNPFLLFCIFLLIFCYFPKFWNLWTLKSPVYEFGAAEFWRICYPCCCRGDWWKEDLKMILDSWATQINENISGAHKRLMHIMHILNVGHPS
jgi:hypothetical protein